MTSGHKTACTVHWLGRVPYDQALHLQTSLSAQVADASRPPCLLLLEHPHTYTLGSRGDPDNLLWGAEELQRSGVSVHWTDRGGDVTYHGPGQLVGYPILPLGKIQPNGRLPKVDYLSYLRQLEEVILRTVMCFGLQGERIPGRTGVWVHSEARPGFPPAPAAKIASIGVKVSAQGVSQHGFALNVDPDMRYWEGIVACGLADASSTSLSGLLGYPLGVKQVGDACAREFGRVFPYDLTFEPLNIPLP